MSAPKKFASRSRAAKPMAMPPMPPKASTPVTLKPRLCRTMSTAVITTEARSSLPSAIAVVSSTRVGP